MTDLYDIIYYPDPILKEISKSIGDINDAIKLQGQRMMETVMAEDNSVGLAANQVGIANRMFIAEINPTSWEYVDADAKKPEIKGTGESRRGNPVLMINPEILKQSTRKSVCTEGCLSLPNQFADIERPSDITIQYIDLLGKKKILDIAGFDSHVFQHELDHLDGVLFIDYLSRLKRGTLIRKLEKFKKSEGLL